MARLILVRHAESTANTSGVVLGNQDPPLTALGEKQATALAQALAGQPLRRVLASPLQRAARTAQAVAAVQDLPVEYHPGLQEMDAGQLSGLSWDDARAKYADFLRAWQEDRATPDLRIPGGETLREVADRAWAVIAPLLAPDDSAAVTIVVSHNFPIRTLICRALDLDLRSWRRFEIGNTARTVLDHATARTVLHTINDRHHLNSDLLPAQDRLPPARP